MIYHVAFSSLYELCLGWIAKFIDACPKAIDENMLLSVLFNYMLHMLIECSDDCHQDSGFIMVVD